MTDFSEIRQCISDASECVDEAEEIMDKEQADALYPSLVSSLECLRDACIQLLGEIE